MADMRYQELEHKVQLTDRWPTIIHASQIMLWLAQRVQAQDWNYHISVDVISFVHAQDAVAFGITFCDIIRK